MVARVLAARDVALAGGCSVFEVAICDEDPDIQRLTAIAVYILSTDGVVAACALLD